MVGCCVVHLVLVEWLVGMLIGWMDRSTNGWMVIWIDGWLDSPHPDTFTHLDIIAVATILTKRFKLCVSLHYSNTGTEG